MTQPAQPQPLPVDPGNPLLGSCQANLTVTPQDTPVGQLLAVTLRTTSTTVTVFLSRADAETWARLITQTAARLSGSGLIVAGPGVPESNGNRDELHRVAGQPHQRRPVM